MEEQNEMDNNFIPEYNNDNYEDNNMNDNNNNIPLENKIDGKIALNNLMERNEGYKQIYNILFGKEVNKNEENKFEIKRTSKRNNTYKSLRTDFKPIITNKEIIRRNNKSKKYDYKMEMLYGKIHSLQKEYKRPKSMSKYPIKQKMLSFKRENFQIDENKKEKTPFQFYYNEFKKEINEEPLKINKSSFNKIEIKKPNFNFYKNTISYDNNNNNNYMTFDNVDNWINNEKRIQRNSFYFDKRSEISNLVSYTRNNENFNSSNRNKFPKLNFNEGINGKNNKYYSSDYFMNELNRFSSLLKGTNDNKKKMKNNFIIGTLYSRK